MVNGWIPETLTSLQVPFTSTFPSGQVHLAPVGLSKHMKSQDILEHGLGPVDKQQIICNLWPEQLFLFDVWLFFF